MYYRSPERPHISTPLPLHYSGNAFHPDGTPAAIPVRRESEIPLREQTEEVYEQDVPPVKEEELTFDKKTPDFKSKNEEKEECDRKKDDHIPFLSRLLGGILPDVREDDLLLLLLLFLLSREDGNEEVLLLLALLLFSN